jgi:hypothetical protein
MKRDSSHIYEIHELNSLVFARDRDTYLLGLGLSDINDVVNQIALCAECHKHFDKHRIGIHPLRRVFIVRSTIRDKYNQGGDFQYSNLHGRSVNFRGVTQPTLELLSHRYAKFLASNTKKIYCSFCPQYFNKKQNFEDHVSKKHAGQA